MALLSKDNQYARVEEIVIGKNVMRFFLRVYSDMTASPYIDRTITAPYDIAGANPYQQAYEWVKKEEEFSTWTSDEKPAKRGKKSGDKT